MMPSATIRARRTTLAEPLRLAEVAADKHDHLVGQAQHQRNRVVPDLAGLPADGSVAVGGACRRSRHSAR